MLNILQYSPLYVDYKKIANKAPLLDEFYGKVVLLPEKIKLILFDLSDTVSALSQISASYKLTTNQSADLSRIVRDVLLGDLYIGDMPKIIKEKLQIDDRSAQEIASKIALELFKPAMDDIKKMQIEKFKDRIAQASDKSSSPIANPQDKPIGNVVNLRGSQK